jgi:TatA/E family protein of Tat protein translocase
MVVPLPLGFLSGSPGMGELLLLFAVILILFGPRRLPEVAKMIGRAMQELRRASQDFRDQVMRIDTPATPSPRNGPRLLSPDRTSTEPEPRSRGLEATQPTGSAADPAVRDESSGASTTGTGSEGGGADDLAR